MTDPDVCMTSFKTSVCRNLSILFPVNEAIKQNEETFYFQKKTNGNHEILQKNKICLKMDHKKNNFTHKSNET